MTIELFKPRDDSEQSNAEQLKTALLTSEPKLGQDGISLAIIPKVFTGHREIDYVLVFKDFRKNEDLFKTTKGVLVKSFVVCVEVKQNLPDCVRYHDAQLEVHDDNKWHDATAQFRAQSMALKDFQEHNTYIKRNKTFVKSVIWLPHISTDFIDVEQTSKLGAVLGDFNWQQLMDCCETIKSKNMIKVLADAKNDSKNHSYDSMVEILTAKINPTFLDLKRVNKLTKKRFGTEKQAYVDKLGCGLLIFRGRAGTGKTFALIQMAIHLGRQGKTTRIVTYNHGLISDMKRIMAIIRERHEDILVIPKIETRWMLMKELFILSFGIQTNNDLRKSCSNLKKRENLFLHALRNPEKFLTENKWVNKNTYCRKPPAPYDFLLIDEGQDWSIDHRDVMYDIFGPGRIIVADGIDQFVSETRCDWDRRDIVKNRIVNLKVSRRTKATSCNTINDIAEVLEIPNWDVEPDKFVSGGRITVLVEPQPQQAIERALEIFNADLTEQPRMKPIDALICLPCGKTTPGTNYCDLFEDIQKKNSADYWRGYSWKIRRNREYPYQNTALRAVLYESCRGMEGWTSICMALDKVYDYKIKDPDVEKAFRKKMEGDLLAEDRFKERLATEQKKHALNWLMIALTRSMDHLVIHLTDKNSAVGCVLQKIDHNKIDWK